VRSREDPPDHGDEELGMPVAGESLLHEKLAVPQQGDRAELRGRLKGQQVHASIIAETLLAINDL
jgi:hypothetical protein